MFRLRTLGSLSLTGDAGDPRSILSQPKRLAVLAYVAVNGAGAGLRRDALLALFWSELPEDQARPALRQTLYQLRLALGEDVFIGGSPDEVAVDRGVLWCDAVDFDHAIREAHFEEALALYLGDFLPAFFFANQSSEFEQWVDETRAKYRRDAARAADSLAKRTAAHGPPEEAVAWAERAARLAPDDEGATRQLIEVLERFGNRAGALRVYEDFSRRLRETYETRPAAATEALVARIRNQEAAGSVRAGASATAPRSGDRSSERHLVITPEPPVVGPPSAGRPPVDTPRPAPPAPSGGTDKTRQPRAWSSPVARGMLALAGALVVVAALWIVRQRGLQRPPGSAVPTIAVVPFEKRGAGDDGYLADGIADEVRGRLTEVAGMRVIAAASSRQYAGTSKPVPQIGQELGVEYLLFGRVVWSHSAPGPDSIRLQISPELVRTSDGTTAWATTFDVSEHDLSRIPGQIADSAALALRVPLDQSTHAILVRPATPNAAAYDAYLRGAALFRVGPADAVLLHRAVADLEQAVALDPSNARAWALLATTRARLYLNSGSMKRDDIVRARVAAERAIELEPRLAAGHGAMAAYYDAADGGDPEGELREYRAGLSIAPGDASMVSGLSYMERIKGHWERAIHYTREAELLDPRSATPPYNLALIYLYLHRFADARAASEHDLALGGADSPQDWELATMIRLSDGDQAGARSVLARGAQAVDPTSLATFVASYADLFWALDEPQQKLLGRLTPTSFGDDRLLWSYALMGVARLRGDQRAVHAFADTARREAITSLSNAPNDPQLHALLGVIDATLGHHEDAVREGARAVTLCPISRDALLGPYIFEQLARIYMLVGESDRAVSTLDSLTRVPYYVTPQWLRIDPTWTPLHGSPAFERLISRPAPAKPPEGE